mmetsp:Transcript_27136/g.61297  ORF Transcript_27136/g.61297 Transcript_27136/m.61297 type:complete len:126 (+) Transcript_27136:466-843(+)
MTTFDQFMVNIKLAIENWKMSPKHILPFHTTSIIAARWLKATNFTPDLVYIDSAHEQDETLLEIRAWWDALSPGGMLLGDDYNWPGVAHDVQKFGEEHPEGKLQVFRIPKSNQRCWYMIKPGSRF